MSVHALRRRMIEVISCFTILPSSFPLDEGNTVIPVWHLFAGSSRQLRPATSNENGLGITARCGRACTTGRGGYVGVFDTGYELAFT